MKTRRSRKWSGRAIEGLEPRRNPSTATAAAAAWSGPADFPIFEAPKLSTTPADGAVFESADAPSTLTFHLGGPAVVFWSGAGGVHLRRVSEDGSETILDSSDWGPAQLTGDSATLALPAGLPAGRYRIVILGGSSLAFIYSQQRQDPMEDRVIAEFQVKPRTDVDLGIAGSVVRGVTGTLEGSKSDASYRIHLPKGVALWRLALQLDAGRIGSGLIAGITVFDADGRQVASGSVGSDFKGDHPNDPYLFAGLPPGDYIVVVSKSAAMSGGGFRLNVAADPVKGPTRVTSFKPERSIGGVNGFTIGFDSAIDPTRLRSDSVHIVDASGSRYAFRLVSVGDGLTSARFESLSPLPAGNYRLVAAGDRPIADLIGRLPVANSLPAGVLAAWTVKPGEAGTAGGGDTRPAVVAGSLDLKPGAVLEIPIVLGPKDSLLLVSKLKSGTMRIEVIGRDGLKVVHQGTDSPATELWINPGEGSYILRIISVGDSPLAGSWSLNPTPIRDESIVARAVGSQGMIGLRLSEGTGEVSPAAPSPAPRGASQPAAGRSELGPSPWAYGSGSTPIGRPISTADAVTPVGPTTADGLTSVAWAQGNASAEGVSFILSVGGRGDEGAPREAGSPKASETTPGRTGAVDGEVARTGPDGDSIADDGALERAERVAEAVMGGLRWIVGRPAGDDPDVRVEATDGGLLAQAAPAPREVDGSEGKVQRSALDLPFTVLLVTASTFHLRRATRRWWGRRKLAADAIRPAGQPPYPAPKTLFRGPRRMTPAGEASRPKAPRRG